ncbi:hypothetical protein [Rhodococcus wratislaviensis]|uniref:hypothetical protein n=1 Tax=Rhodococcus wratislaviensis TaxID=44752 RepID=UPI0004B9835D|nr:hypothetical protein [Rhodococcus wratislaviensis]
MSAQQGDGSGGGDGGFWSIITTAEWAANVGVPTLVASIAFLTGWIVLFVQIRHSRTLAREEQRRGFGNAYASIAESAVEPMMDATNRFLMDRSETNLATFRDALEPIHIRLIMAAEDLHGVVSGNFSLAAMSIAQRTEARIESSAVDPSLFVRSDDPAGMGISSWSARSKFAQITTLLAIDELRQLVRDLRAWDGSDKGERRFELPERVVPLPVFVMPRSFTLEGYVRSMRAWREGEDRVVTEFTKRMRAGTGQE